MKTDFNAILNDVTSYLDHNLPHFLTYHNKEHTLYVLEKAIFIAKKEKVKNTELELIKVAALYHDIGFTKTNVGHEKKGCEIAKEQLKNYGYSHEDITTVCGMIMATEIPQNPQNLSEKIIADADLEYLATSHFRTTSKLLFKELKHYNNDLTLSAWNTIQIEFIKNHSYHTNYCRRYKTFRKNKNLTLLQP